MGIEQTMAQEALHIRNAVVVDAVKTLTIGDMEGGSVAATYGAAQAITLPDLDAPPFFIAAAGGQTVTVTNLYDGTAPHTATSALTTKLSGLCFRVKGVGWFCISTITTS